MMSLAKRGVGTQPTESRRAGRERSLQKQRLQVRNFTALDKSRGQLGGRLLSACGIVATRHLHFSGYFVSISTFSGSAQHLRSAV